MRFEMVSILISTMAKGVVLEFVQPELAWQEDAAWLALVCFPSLKSKVA